MKTGPIETPMAEPKKIKPKSKSQNAGRGGLRPGAGRPPGSSNRATLEQKSRLSDLAKTYADIAFEALVDVAQSGPTASARVAAACAILDRAFGRPGTSVVEAQESEDPFASALREIVRRGSMAPIGTDRQKPSSDVHEQRFAAPTTR